MTDMSENVLPRPPRPVWVFLFASGLLASWLLFDGLHYRLFGDYVRVEGQLGLWATVAGAIGLSLADLSWTFILLGSALWAAAFGMREGSQWAYRLGLSASILLLPYLGFGTPLVLVCLGAVLWPTTRAYCQKVAV